MAEQDDRRMQSVREAAEELERATDNASSVLREVAEYWKDDVEMSRFLSREISDFEENRKAIVADVRDSLQRLEPSESPADTAKEPPAPSSF